MDVCVCVLRETNFRYHLKINNDEEPNVRYSERYFKLIGLLTRLFP